VNKKENMSHLNVIVAAEFHPPVVKNEVATMFYGPLSWEINFLNLSFSILILF